jgi:hypothetical protein
MTEEEIKIWDQYAMEFFKARLGDSNFWQPQNLAEMSYRYATAMMREREIQIAILSGDVTQR